MLGALELAHSQQPPRLPRFVFLNCVCSNGCSYEKMLHLRNRTLYHMWGPECRSGRLSAGRQLRKPVAKLPQSSCDKRLPPPPRTTSNSFTASQPANEIDLAVEMVVPTWKMGAALHAMPTSATIAQLGERQAEDLKVPGSIPIRGALFAQQHPATETRRAGVCTFTSCSRRACRSFGGRLPASLVGLA
jgi:hypothetical protein